MKNSNETTLAEERPRARRDGMCPVCGRVSKLDDNGVLQKHVIRKQHGKKTKICRGSGHQPEW